MTNDNLQQHLDHARYGTKRLNPDEQRKWMGTFRERCYLTMTIAQMKIAKNQTNFVKELQLHKDGTILLNGEMDQALQKTYLYLCQQQKRSFTIVNDCVLNTPESFGLLLVSTDAVNQPVIDIEKKYPLNTAISNKKKESFWSRLFHS